jgi:hypothetical protein
MKIAADRKRAMERAEERRLNVEYLKLKHHKIVGVAQKAGNVFMNIGRNVRASMEQQTKPSKAQPYKNPFEGINRVI